MTFFLDANTCIYALKGLYPKIRLRMEALSPSSLKIPSIVKGELLFGARKSDRPEPTLEVLDRFLAPFAVVPFDAPAAEIYAQVRFDLERRGKPIGPNDLIVAATAMAAQGTLVTHNVREFRRVNGLLLEDWTK